MNKELEKIISHISTKKIEIIGHIIIIFLFPIFLIKAGVIPIEKRVIVLVVLVTLLLLVLIGERWKAEMLGLRIENIKKYFFPYLIFTMLGAFAITTLGESIGYEETKKWWTHRHFVYLFFVVSLFQEVAYRGYLIPALAKISKNHFFVLLVNTILFTFLHIIFPNPIIMLPLAFVGGIYFAFMYMRFPSLPLIIISHSVLNFLAVLYGFFVIPNVTY